MRIQCKLPAKLILSGEHSVVYGAPALSLAIASFGTANLQFSATSQPNFASQISINLVDLKQQQTFSYHQAWLQAEQVLNRYQDFLTAKLSIEQVCQSSFDLVLVGFYLFQQNHNLAAGNWSFSYQSEIWQNRGLGSSAALIVGVLSSLFKAHQIKNSAQLLDLATQIESLQHGKSSGLDPATILHGNLIRFQAGKIQPQKSALKLENQAWLIDTGAPASSTGACVSHVQQQNFNAASWQEFSQVSEQLNQAWLKQDLTAIQSNIKQNQALLQQIGVVPAKVQQFIQILNQQPNSAAKICGAGSVAGDNAGVVLLLSPNSPADICAEFGYSFMKLQICDSGASCEMD